MYNQANLSIFTTTTTGSKTITKHRIPAGMHTLRDALVCSMISNRVTWPVTPPVTWPAIYHTLAYGLWSKALSCYLWHYITWNVPSCSKGFPVREWDATSIYLSMDKVWGHCTWFWSWMHDTLIKKNTSQHMFYCGFYIGVAF